MEPSEVQRAVDAARATASSLGLRADDALVVHNSNRIAVRLRPSDVLARVAPLAPESADELELEVARLLMDVGAPVAGPVQGLEPRVHVRDGFGITLWTYYEPVASAHVEPAEYADVLLALHAGLRHIEVRAPHFRDRVAEAQ